MLDSIFNDVLKDIDRKHLVNEFDNLAEMLKLLYDSFKKTGFTPNQSLELTKETLRTAALTVSTGDKK